MVAPSTSFTLKQNENLELERLPSPEEQAMLVSLEYPSTLVPVDVSGTSFNKMSLLRRSLMHVRNSFYIIEIYTYLYTYFLCTRKKI